MTTQEQGLEMLTENTDTMLSSQKSSFVSGAVQKEPTANEGIAVSPHLVWSHFRCAVSPP